MARKALAYVRVSQEGENPENQIHVIKKYAEENDIEVLKIFVDENTSGSITPREREAYKNMIDIAKKLDIKLILFYDLSRLSRNLEDGLLELKNLAEDNIEFKFVSQGFLDHIDDPLLRKKVISDFLWFAELYRADIIKRTKDALKRAKKDGKNLGRPSFELPKDEIIELRKKGMSYTKIYRYLVRNGYLTTIVKTGKNAGAKRVMSFDAFKKRVKEILQD